MTIYQFDWWALPEDDRYNDDDYCDFCFHEQRESILLEEAERYLEED